MTRPIAAAEVDFVPTADVLLRHPTMVASVELPVLGIATRFETNSRYVAGVVEEAFGGWRRAAAAAGGDSSGSLLVRVVVHEGAEHPGGGHAPVRHLCPDATRVIAHSPGSFAVSDPARGEAVAYVSTALAADRAHFRGAMLEAITLSLLAHFDRHPLHAAAVGSGERAVLLAGPSGAGKSSLAYAAHEAGLGVLSDDRVWVQLAPALRVWGWPGRVRLLPDAPDRFPDAARDGTLVEADGKRKLAVDLRPAGGAAPHPHAADRAVVCLLSPQRAARPVLERASPDEIVDSLSRDVAPGFDRFPERHGTVVRALAARGGWRLVPSGDPREALPMLRRMVEEG
ncbi:MAG TPA: hypothetical protein VKA84_04150 [Gemmatimonadaceae bacterium]|nr:hypothetical protein [Gemmatimonadaceae bacterium]